MAVFVADASAALAWCFEDETIIRDGIVKLVDRTRELYPVCQLGTTFRWPFRPGRSILRPVKLTTFKERSTLFLQKIGGWLYEKRVERRMKAFLRSLSRQIVDDSNVTVRVVPPGRAVGHMVINVVKIDKSNYFLWQNCIARGWVEEKYPVIVPADGSAPTVTQTLDGTFQFAYTLTKLGWDIINRAYVLMYTAIILSAVGLILNALHKSK